MAKIKINKERCKGCTICIDVCPKKIIILSSDFNSKGLHFITCNEKEKECTGCMICAINCPDVAIEVEK